METNSNQFKRTPDIELVKNCVVWSLAQGEIARRINVAEFENYSTAKGVYVQEGVVAVLMIDGKVVTKLSSGVYYFPTTVERFGETLRHIWRFFTGRKEGGSYNEDETRRGRLGSELQNLRNNSFIEVILFVEGYIPVVLGVRQADFYPYTVQTRRSTLSIGLSLNLEVTDFVRFRKNYLIQKPYCRIWDLQIQLVDPIGNTLQDLLAHEEIEATVLPPMLKARIKDALIQKINYVLLGASVAQIIDITIKSEDFDRFHELEHKLYCSEKELEYLIRTNTFKNRLVAENNNQRLREARSEEDLRYSLNQINKGKLLHDDEMEAFCQLLASQKKIREAQTDADTDKALLEIKGNRLVSEDDYEELVHELKKKKDARQEVETILQYQSIRRTETERLNVQKDIEVLSAKNEGEIEQAQYETAKQELVHRHEIEKDEVLHKTDLKDIERGETRKDDDYSDERRQKEHSMDMSEARDDMELFDEQEKRRIERERAANQLVLDRIARMAEIQRANKAQDYQHDAEMEKIRNENEQSLKRILAGMTADQIAASNITDLSDEAQVALTAAISSQKENEWLKKSSEERVRIIQDLADRSVRMDKESREQQERTFEKMMQFMSDAMKTNASVVTNAVNGQQATAKAQMDTIKDVATHRIGEVTTDKDEAKAEARHEKDRLDRLQDTAMHYTTMTSETKMQTEGMKAIAGANDVVVYIIPEFGTKVFDFTSVLAMIKDEMVTPDTEMIVQEETYKAYDLNEFKKIFDRLYSVECPKCGHRGLKGYICSECGTQL